MEKSSLPLAYYLNNGAPDKTGYQQLALNAFYKAVSFHPNEMAITIGPNATTIEKKERKKELENSNNSDNESRIASLSSMIIESNVKDYKDSGSDVISKLSNGNESVQFSEEASTSYIEYEPKKPTEDDSGSIYFCESPEGREEKLIRQRILTSLENICLAESQEKINSMRREWIRRDEETMSRLQDELNATKSALEEKMIDQFHQRQIVLDKLVTESSEVEPLKPILSKAQEQPILRKNETLKKCIQEEKKEAQEPYKVPVATKSSSPVTLGRPKKEDSPQTAFFQKPTSRSAMSSELNAANKDSSLSIGQSNAHNQELVEESPKADKKPLVPQQKVEKLQKKKVHFSEDTLSMEEDLSIETQKQTEKSEVIDPETVRIKSVMQHYNRYWKIYSEVTTSLKEFMNDDSLKKFRSECQRAVNNQVNAISGSSAAHLNDKLNKLTTLLSGSPIIINNKSFNPSQHPLGVKFCTYLLAEKVVEKGGADVSVNSESAFPIALVALEIWRKFPTFGDLLMGAFHNKCPYLVPIYWMKEDNMSNENYYRKLGFRIVDGEREDVDVFSKRQGGIVRLYFSIIISQTKNSTNWNNHPLPLNEAWRWLATFTSLEPSPEITATLLHEMLYVAGHSLLKMYGKQFLKLIYLVCVHFLPKIEKVTPDGKGGPVSRLKSFLENLIRTQVVGPPKGILPANFW